MSYTALYRRFRPDSFDKVIGQDHITTTLTNQIKSGKIAHAYLFCGTRGTGKTTCAKIFARAINCERPKDGSPCNECETCRALLAGNSIDINEIDAASNNGVDEIREIKENVQYTPTVGRFKVYIIDEVHMLSQAAFNALLKTLEEPPKHAVFILATTESHKLPATILSRCMRFDFKLVGDDKLAELLKSILTEIGVSWEEDALKLITRAGEGSVRDMLTIADTCVSYCGERLTFEKVSEVIGVTDRTVVVSFADRMLAGDVGGVFEISSDLFAKGKAVAAFNRDVVTALRDFCVILSTKNASDLLVCSENTFAEMAKTAKKYSIERILECIDILASAENEIKFSLHPRILFEAAAMRCAKNAGVSTEALVARIQRLEQMLASGVRPASFPNPASAPARPAPIPNPASAPARPAPIPNPASAPARLTPIPNPETAARRAEFADPSVIPAPVSPKPIASIKSVAPETVFASESEPIRGLTPHKVWGTVIRTLRERQNGLLYTICSGLSCEIAGQELTVLASTDQEVSLLSRENNKKILEEIASGLGLSEVRFAKKGERPSAGRDEEMEKFRTLLDGKLIEK